MPDFCAKVREALRDPDVGVVGCVGAIGVRSIAWWEGSVALASFVHRLTSTAAATCRRSRGPGTTRRPTPAPARSTPSTASCSRSRRGPCATSASTSRSARCTATTSTSASRCAPPAARWSRPTSAPSTTTALDALRATRSSGSRRTCASPRSGTGGCRASARAPGTLEGARAARRGRARRRTLRDHCERVEAAARVAELERALAATQGSISWRPHRFAAARARRPRMIAFGTSIAEPDAYRALRRAGHPRRPPSPTPRCSPSPRSASIAAATTCCSRPPPRYDDLEALVHRAPARRDHRPATSARRSARRWPIPTSASSAASAATGVRSIAWWEGAVTAAPVSTSYPEYGGGELAGVRLGRARPRRRRRSTPWPGSCSCSRPGRAQPPLRRGACSSTTATTSTSAARRARAGRSVAVADLGVTYHHRSSSSGPRRLDRGAHAAGREVGPQEPTRSWKTRARRAEAEREAARAVSHAHSLAQRPVIAVRNAAVDEVTGSPHGALTEPLRRVNHWRRRGR